VHCHRIAKVETIEEPLMREIRYLDKLIDELAKGKAMEKGCGTERGRREVANSVILVNCHRNSLVNCHRNSP
jgi:hypothetical protein